MNRISNVRKVELVGIMPIRSPDSRTRPFDQAAFLSGNSIADGLRGGAPAGELDVPTALRTAVAGLLDETGPTAPELAAKFLFLFNVLAARVAIEPDLGAILSDLEMIARRLDAPDVTSLADALRRSSTILEADRDQLPEQILGRLLGQDSDRMRRLLAGAAAYKTGCWLRPVTASFAARQEVVGQLDGHASAALFDPAGLLLTIDSRGWLKFIDLSGRTPPPPVSIGGGEPTGLASDGRVVAIPTREGPICLVDPARGRRHPLVPSGSGATLAVAFTTSGRLVSGGTDGVLRLWSISDDGHADGEVASIDLNDLTVHALLPLAGDRLAVGTDPDPVTRHCVQIWNLRTMRRDAAFARHDWPVTALDARLDHDSGAELLFAAANDELSAWRLDRSPACLRRIHCQDTTFHALAYLDGKLLAADAHGALRLFSLIDGTEIGGLSPHSGLVPSIAADKSRRRFATVSYDQTVRLWDASALAAAPPPGHRGPVTALALTPDGNRLLSASKDGRVLVWDARTGTLTGELGRHGHWVSAIWAGTDDIAVTAGWDGMIRCWDLRPARPAVAIKTEDKHLTALACAHDGTRAVTASTDGAIRIWDLARRAEQTMITSPDKDVVAVAIDSEEVRWVTDRGRLYRWPARGKPIQLEIPGTGRVTACDLGAPGCSSVAGRLGGQLVAFDADGGATSADGGAMVFGEGDCGPTAIARDAGGRILLAAYGLPHLISDNTARLWRDDDRSAPAAVLVGDVPWTAAAIAGDGRHLYLGDESGAVHVIEPVLPGLIPPDPPRGPR